MRSLFIALLSAAALFACAAPPAPPGPTADPAFLTQIKGMPQGPARLALIVEHLRTAQPGDALRFDALSRQTRADEAAAAARLTDRVVIIAGAKVRRVWSAREDAHGMTTADVIDADGMVNRGFRFGEADAKRVLAMRDGSRFTASCLLIERHLEPAGCILLFD